ncbi:MAG: radical SAM protein [Candidatus Woesearchaeota archaeon]|jgi:hypothetical protein|nr:radical SAM protein [Candidatus Woesearchaeota archaeon]
MQYEIHRGKDTHCQLCAFEWGDRITAIGEHYRLKFNLDGDLTGATTPFETPNLVYTARGRVNGFLASANLGERDSTISDDADSLRSGYFVMEMPEEMRLLFGNTVARELQKLCMDNPDEIFSRASGSSSNTQRKNARLTELTDTSRLVLPGDTVESAYELLPLIVQRGCYSDCPGCEIGSEVGYRADDSSIRAQLDFFHNEYPLTSRTYKGLLMGGEDPLMLGTDRLVEIMQTAEAEFGLSRNPTRIGLDGFGDYDTTEGFAYMFMSFKSIKRKSVEDLRRLKEAGLRWANIGLESADQRILDEHFPKQTLDDVTEGIDKLNEAGVNFSLNVIAGLREGNVDHLLKTSEFLGSMGYDGRVFLARFKRSNGLYELNNEEFFREARQFVEDYEKHPGVDWRAVKAYPMVFH